MYMYVVFAAKGLFGVIVHVWCDNVSFVPYLQGILRCFAFLSNVVLHFIAIVSTNSYM